MKIKLALGTGALLFASFIGANNSMAECTSEPDYNNGKEVTVQGVCQCDETSRRQECYQTPPGGGGPIEIEQA